MNKFLRTRKDEFLNIAQLINEIVGHKGTIKLLNDTELVDNGSHYVGDYLGWGIWVFVENYHAMQPKNRTKYAYLTKDEREYPISWTLKLGERFKKRDITTFCAALYG